MHRIPCLPLWGRCPAGAEGAAYHRTPCPIVGQPSLELVGAGACRRCERVARGSALPPLCRLAATSLPAGESLALGGQPADAGRRERRPLQGLPKSLGLIVGVDAHIDPPPSIGTLPYVDGGVWAPRPTPSHAPSPPCLPPQNKSLSTVNCQLSIQMYHPSN